MSEEINLQRGRYRRIYDGFLVGKRINSVSLAAEAWFWRIHALADDFGNLLFDQLYLRNHGAPRRTLTAAAVRSMSGDLVRAGLIVTYKADGDLYGHIKGFLALQPAPRNGRRLRGVPPYPGESQEDLGNPGESGGIPGPALTSASASEPASTSACASVSKSSPPPTGSPPHSSAQASSAAVACSPVAYDILRKVWRNGTADTLARHPNATEERVAFLADRIIRDKVKKPPGFMRKGIEEGWEVPTEWAARYRAATGGAG